MKKVMIATLITLLSFITTIPMRAQAIDDLIKKCLQEIKADSIKNYIQELEKLNRYSFAKENRDVAVSIRDRFISFGLEDTELDSFSASNGTQFNVVAKLKGNKDPDKIVLLGAHHDAVQSCPGADDNASGVSAVYEIARVLLDQNIKLSYTIHFVTFCGEEVGLLGSTDYANKASTNNMDLKYMMNFDMILYLNTTPDNWYLEYNQYSGAEWLVSATTAMTEKYTTLKARKSSDNTQGDSYPFYQKKFNAIWIVEDFGDGVHPQGLHPHYHKSSDKSSNYSNYDYPAEIVKASFATIMYLDDSLSGGTTTIASLSKKDKNTLKGIIAYVNKKTGSLILKQNFKSLSHNKVISIYSANGRLLFSQILNTQKPTITTQFNMYLFQRGVYFIRLQDGNGSTGSVYSTKYVF